jgi:hypothetical protein
MKALGPALILCLTKLLLANEASAQTRSQVYGDSLTKQAQTLYLRADSGMTTFDSEAAGSKDTRSTQDFEVGGWLGEARIAGIKVQSREDKVPFELNQSKLNNSFTDVRLLARLWWFIPSIGMSLSEVNVSRADTQTVGLFGTGISAGLGANVTLYPGILLAGDYLTVRSNNVYDKLTQTSKLGHREEIDGHIAFDLTERIVDLIVGYRMRKFEIETTDETYKELAQGAYAGIRLGVYF